jgi:hypothetical protein
VIGITRRRVAGFEEPVKKLGEDRGSSIFSGKACFLLSRRAGGATWHGPSNRLSTAFPASKSTSSPDAKELTIEVSCLVPQTDKVDKLVLAKR